MVACDIRPSTFQLTACALPSGHGRVVGSESNLPPKVVALFYLENIQHQMSTATGLLCYVPPFICVRTGNTLDNDFPATLVQHLNLATPPPPGNIPTHALDALRQQLRGSLDFFLQIAGSSFANNGIIIRSAGQREDGETLSFAGVYDSTRLTMYSPEEFVRVGVEVALSPYKPRGLRYHFFNEIPISPIDLIVQTLVPNAVALNFTVASTGVTSVFISGLGQHNFIFRPDAAGAETAFLDPTTNLPAQSVPNRSSWYGKIKTLVDKVSEAFTTLAQDNQRISIECAFDKVRALHDGQVNGIALLQIRTLPSAKAATTNDLKNPAAIESSLGFIPAYSHLTPGPCTFDSIVCVGTRAIDSLDLGIQLISVLTRLRTQNLTQPLLVLDRDLAHGRGSMNLLFRLSEVSPALPFIGVIDEAYHLDGDIARERRVVLAGHLEALLTEKLQIVANVPNFTDKLRQEFNAGVRLVEMREELTPTQFECALAADFIAFDPDPWESDESDSATVAVTPNSPRSAERPILIATTVYIPARPLTIEVVDSPTGQGNDDDNHRGFSSEATHSLKISR